MYKQYHKSINRWIKGRKKERYDEGHRVGCTEGHEKGFEDGTREIFQYLLVIRFGDVPPAFEKRIESAQICQLETWIGEVLNANSIIEVFDNDTKPN